MQTPLTDRVPFGQPLELEEVLPLDLDLPFEEEVEELPELLEVPLFLEEEPFELEHFLSALR